MTAKAKSEEKMKAVHAKLVTNAINVSRLIKGPNEHSYFTLLDIGGVGVWRIGAHHLKDLNNTLTVDLHIPRRGMTGAHRFGSVAAAVIFVSHFIKRDPTPRVPTLESLLHKISKKPLGDRYGLDLTQNSADDIASMLRELNEQTWPPV
jgi:hypothetical protein